MEHALAHFGLAGGQHGVLGLARALVGAWREFDGGVPGLEDLLEAFVGLDGF